MNTIESSMSGYCVSFDPTVGVGALGSNVPLTSVRDPVWMNIDNNIRSKQDCNSVPVINVASHIPKDAELSNWYVNQTGRGEIHPSTVEQVNLKGQDKWNNLSFLDEQKVTTKETTEYAYSGNAQREQDGTEFWTYDDTPRVTTKETTEFAYAGNTQRQQDGTEFWTYDDTPRVTTKETTEYAYAGNTARGDMGTMNYNQYTGYGNSDIKDGKRYRSGGADTYAIRGSTLVTNYMPIAGRQNLRQDAEGIMGKINFGGKSDQNYDGPGTIDQSIPDGARFQNNYFIGKQHPRPNKLQAVDDRQIAGYQVGQLHKNPLSIYTQNPQNRIPGFFEYIQPQDFSTMVEKEDSELEQPNPATGRGPSYKGVEDTVEKYGAGPDTSVQVYPNYEGKRINSNAAVVYNMDNDSKQNINNFITHGNKVNAFPKFEGKAYSGDVNFEWGSNGKVMENVKNRGGNNTRNSHQKPYGNQKITLGGKNEPSVYGNLYSVSQLLPGMAEGIEDKKLQKSQNNINPEGVCEPNKALKFSNTLVLTN